MCKEYKEDIYEEINRNLEKAGLKPMKIGETKYLDKILLAILKILVEDRELNNLKKEKKKSKATWLEHCKLFFKVFK